MTADVFAEDIAACRAAGMDGYALKPVDMDTLCREIQAWVDAEDSLEIW